MPNERIDYHWISRRGAMIINHFERSSNYSSGSRCGNPAFNGTFRQRSLSRGIGTLLCMLAIAAVCSSLMVRAQELTATLSGVVTDSSGAVIPHASITITQNGVNGASRVVESDDSGNYTATNLAAGTYSVTATVAGFESFKGQKIVLNVAEKHAFNIALRAGAVTTTVTVEDNPVAVDTETSGQAGTIQSQQVEELEINSRNFEQLITLQPGVVNQLGDEANSGSTAISVNGARTSANNWTVDGADINDSGSNTTAVSEPSMEAIQEITLERGNYDAGYGRSGGGQVLVATKSGTSAFHGNGYEFVRTTDFNANDYLNKESQIAAGQPNTPGVYHQNVYGFTIGGPIYIPKVYNEDKKKTFFFWSEDWHKINQAGSSIQLNTPTPDQLAGNFTVPAPAAGGALIAPPAVPAGVSPTCETFTRNADGSGQGTINVAQPGCVSNDAQVYVTDVFAPNANASGVEVVNVPAQNDYRDDIVRIDHYFNDKVHFYARGMNDIMPVTEPLGLWAGNNYPKLAAAAVDSPGKNVVGNLSYAISPTIVNELEFVYSQGTYHSSFTGTPFADSASALASLSPQTQKYQDPYGRLPGVAINNIQSFSAGSTPWKERNLDRTYFDNLAISAGKNTLRFGFQIQQMLKSENAVAGEANFTFAQAYNPFANFLLGNVSTYSQQNEDTIPDLNYYNREVYAQDDFKLNKKLTLNLGLRWSSFPSATDKNNTLTNFDPLLYSPAAAPVIDPTTGNFIAGQTLAGSGAPLIPVTYANGIIFPTGAACAKAQTFSAQVQCSPFGGTINPNTNDNFAPRIGFAYNPDGRGLTSIRGGFGVFYDRLLNGIYEQNAFYDPPVVQTVTVNDAYFDTAAGATGATNYGPNLLWTTGTPTFRAPNYFDWNFTVERQLLPTTVLSVAWVANESRHLLGEYDGNQPTAAARMAAPAGADVNSIRPFLGYSYMRTKSPIFTSNYNSLQVDLSHRSGNLTVNLAYTWSKVLSTNSNDRGTAATDTYNLKNDYGPTTFNTPQVLLFNYVYTLPFFKSQNGFEGRALGGWELSGITTLESGSSFSLIQSTDPFATAYGGRGLGIGIVDPDNASRVSQIAAVHMTKKPGQWFTPSSFAPTVGQFSALKPGSLLGPGMDKWDIALAKNTTIAEHVNFQIRVEAFNVFNHPIFGSPSSSSFGGTSGIDNNIGDTQFGTVNADHEPRILQMGGKIRF
jgi:hypothetical protein